MPMCLFRFGCARSTGKPKPFLVYFASTVVAMLVSSYCWELVFWALGTGIIRVRKDMAGGVLLLLILVIAWGFLCTKYWAQSST